MGYFITKAQELLRSIAGSMEWVEAGFDLGSAAAWRRWGFDLESAADWRDSGFAPGQAAGWRKYDFEPAMAAGWRTSFSLWSAVAWRDAGFDLRSAAAWCKWGFDLESAAVWRDAGCAPGEAAGWRKYDFDLESAEAWRDAGFEPKSAAAWCRWGFDLESAHLWLNVDSDMEPSEAKAWVNIACDPAEASRWKRTGLLTREAVHCRGLGLSPALSASDLRRQRYRRQVLDQAGVPGLEIAEWSDVEGDPVQVAEFFKLGFSALEAARLTGVISASKARDAIDDGVSIDELTQPRLPSQRLGHGEPYSLVHPDSGRRKDPAKSSGAAGEQSNRTGGLSDE